MPQPKVRGGLVSQLLPEPDPAPASAIYDDAPPKPKAPAKKKGGKK